MSERTLCLRAAALVLSVLCATLAVVTPPGLAKPAPKRKAVAAKAVVLMDARTGEVLFAQSPDARRPIASTTKILTAILVVEKAKLTKRVRITRGAAIVGESSMELATGERRTVRELLYAMMLQSANDAAAALAISIARSVPRFAKMMNAKAKAIGALHSRFANPHGLTAPRSYSTARDLALMASYGLKNPVFAQVVKTKVVKMPWPKHPYPRIFRNHNKLLWDLPGSIGVKTGYTDPAGHCLVGAARRGSATVVAVVLGAPTSADALHMTAGLLRRGLAEYRPAHLIRRGQAYGQLSVPDALGRTVSLTASRDVTARLYRGDTGVEYDCVVSRDASLPIDRGEVLGQVEARRNGATLGTAPVVSDRDLDAPNLWDRFGFAWTQRLRELGATAENGTVAP